MTHFSFSLFQKIAPIAALLVAIIIPLPAPAQDIGRVALSVAQVTGQPPNGAARALRVGQSVVLDERVTTAARARAEFLFLDQTSLSMGENTSIVLDRYVYDPSTGTVEMVMRLARGALRFIGGKISDDRPAVIVTPTATIGIRGSTALAVAGPQGTQVVFVAGQELCLTSGGGAPVCTSVIGGVLTNQGFVGQISPETLRQLQAAIDQITAGGGSISDLNGLDLAQFVPLDVVPFSTSGGQVGNQAGAGQDVDPNATPPSGGGVNYTPATDTAPDSAPCGEGCDPNDPSIEYPPCYYDGSC